MPSITDAEARIRAENRPVLFLDTCILLDVVRATYRCLGGCVERASELLGMLTADPPECSLVVASIVVTEWNDNASHVRDEVRGHLVKIQDQARHFHDACHTLGIALGFGRPFYHGVGLADRLHDLSRDLLNRSVRLDADVGCTSRGVGRVVAKTRLPSKAGRSRTASSWRSAWNSPGNCERMGLSGSVCSAPRTWMTTAARLADFIPPLTPSLRLWPSFSRPTSPGLFMR